MASFLTEKAHQGLGKLDKNSPMARELSGLDIENVLKEDVRVICESLSLGEITTLMSLGTQLKLAGGKDREAVKDKIKKIGRDVIGRIEKQSVNLQTPSSCLDLLFDL